MKILKSMFAIGCTLGTVCAFADDCVLNVWEGLGRAQSIQDVATKFEQDTKCKVRISEFEISSQLDKVRKGESPDIFVIEGERVIGAANHEGLLSDIEIMKENKDKYHEVAIKQVYFNEKYYAVPRSIETFLIYYNKDLIDYPFESLKDYIDLNEKLKSQGKYGLVTKLDDFYTAYTFLGSNDFEILDEDGITLNSDDTKVRAKFVQEYAKKYLPKGALGDKGWETINTLFEQGKIAAVINNTGKFIDYAKAGVNYGIAPLPVNLDGKPLTPFYSTYNYAIPTRSNQKEMVQKFLAYLNVPMTTYERYLHTAELPTINDVLNSNLVSNDDFANAIFTQMHTSKQISYDKFMDFVWDPMNDALKKITIDGAEPSKTLDEAVDNMF